MKRIISGDWEGLKVPNWLATNHGLILTKIHDIRIIRLYSINHDCGKHLVKIVDDNGKVHYPSHEESSCNYWLEHFPEETTISWLILNDMFFHTCSAKDLEKTSLSEQDLFTLLITALAEIHANAELFGGIDSTSFKIKYKQLERRGNQLCKRLEKPSENYGHSYIFIRNNLSTAQIAVQSGHSILELSRKIKFENHPSLVYISVKSEFKLKKVIEELIDNEINFTIFREPDLNNEITAIATEPLFNDKRKILERYQLYK